MDDAYHPARDGRRARRYVSRHRRHSTDEERAVAHGVPWTHAREHWVTRNILRNSGAVLVVSEAVDPTDGGADSSVTRARVVQLEAAVAARDRFIAAVGHELRNTMAPLLMLAERFAVTGDAATTARRMQILSRNLNHLTATLDRVSDVAQLRSEQLVLALENVELCAVVRDVVAELGTDALAANVELRVDAAVEVTGIWDRARLRQIASHLIANAIQHTGGGPVDISVTSDERHAVLTVADRGRGIDASRRARLFHAFDLAETKRNGGLGVGLWIVHTLCQNFKGTVSLVEDHVPGACFRVVLPRV
jgi:signal transduction histidine kinase